MDLFISPEHLETFASNVILSSARSFEGEDIPVIGESKAMSKKVLIAEYSGDMIIEDYFWRRNVGHFVKSVRQEDAQGDYGSVIIKLSTHGGYADAATEINNLIKDLKAKGNRKVFIYSNYLMSAGIMATLAADRIVSSSVFSKFGSIGVYISINLYFSELRKKYFKDAYSELSPDKNKAQREFDKDGSTTEYEKELKRVDEVFMNQVMLNRPINTEFTNTLHGGTWMAQESKKRGLVDHILTLDQTVKLITELT